MRDQIRWPVGFSNTSKIFNYVRDFHRFTTQVVINVLIGIGLLDHMMCRELYCIRYLIRWKDALIKPLCVCVSLSVCDVTLIITYGC